MLPETYLQHYTSIKINVLGNEYSVNVKDVTPETTLNAYLRNVLNLKGTKHMCYEGGCGACVVVAKRIDPASNKEEIFAVNSCLVPVLSCSNWEIHTIDGIGGPPNTYHAIQKVLADFNGTQCGFCSPGMVMNMYALYQSGKLTMKEVENSFGGNICRCTGYRPILAAFKSLCKDADESVLGTYPDIEDVDPCKKAPCKVDCIYPCSKKKIPFSLSWKASRWIKVYNFKDLLEELKNVGSEEYMLIAGNTARGVFPPTKMPTVYIDVKDILELVQHQIDDNNLVLGANMSMTRAMDLFYSLPKEHKNFSYLKGLGDHIDLIANVPVRNTGTLAGNLMMKHDVHGFQSDIFVFLETVGATVTIVDTSSNETTSNLKNFINLDMKQKVIKNIKLPALDATYKYESYKIMPRAQNAAGLVNAGFLFKFDGNCIEKASIVYGNINPEFIHASKTENFLIGKDLFNNNTLQEAFEILESELVPDYVPPGPEPEFRKQLAVSLFYKTVLIMAPEAKLSPKIKSGGTKLERPVSKGTQDYETNESLYPLTKAVPKIEALAQTSGRAEYVMDMPDRPHQLHASFVLAKASPTSDILSIDASKALKIPGIVAFYSCKDIPGDNNFMSKDFFSIKEEIFADKTIKYYNQPIGLLVGETESSLYAATPLVSASYSAPKCKPLLTIPDIIKAGAEDKIKDAGKYPAKRKGNDVKHVVKGTFDIGMQYHYHMENQCCRVIPTEDGLDIYASTQWMGLAQSAISEMLKIPANKINVNVRRCGGAFGAKITRNSLLTCAAALAAWKLQKPVSISMGMKDNCDIVGKRLPFYSSYEVGLNDCGVIQYLNAELYSDQGQGGNDVAMPEAISLFMANYDSDTFDLETYLTYSDTHANTWCRAPGTTEGLGAIEAIMEHVAYELDMDPLELRIANITKEKELLNYITDLEEWASIDKRKQEIEHFNKENRWMKKGLAVVPMAYKFNVFGPFFVVVTIYAHDGSVEVCHGGIEVGQGINTKAAQVCAYKLGIPLEKVIIRPSNSFITANNVSTGGSVTSEAVCYGVIQACEELLKRLKPYEKSTWEETVTAANGDYVYLSANGKFTPNEPDVSGYTIYGACATEVLLDVLTGKHLITRVDLIEDTGESMSPLVDIGQVEGAFVMGMGYYTTEHCVFNEEGKLLTTRTWNYKPPGAKDIPIDFRVKFPKNNENPVGVLKSKATGEPPFCMSVCVPLAIRNAVASARNDADSTKSKWYPFSGPSTVEQTFMNCLHNPEQYVL